jgi:hypothetical protein
VEHILLCNPVGAKPARVGIIANLEHPAVDVGRVTSEKVLDVEAVDRPAAIEAIGTAERCRTADLTDIQRDPGSGPAPSVEELAGGRTYSALENT